MLASGHDTLADSSCVLRNAKTVSRGDQNTEILHHWIRFGLSITTIAKKKSRRKGIITSSSGKTTGLRPLKVNNAQGCDTIQVAVVYGIIGSSVGNPNGHLQNPMLIQNVVGNGST